MGPAASQEPRGFQIEIDAHTGTAEATFRVVITTQVRSAAAANIQSLLGFALWGRTSAANRVLTA